MKIALSLALTLSVLSSLATGSPCQVAPTDSRATLSVESGHGKAFDTAPNSDVSLERYHLEIRPRDNQAIAVGFGHQYSIVDIDNLPGSGDREISPVTNGHLHTLYIPMDLSSLVGEPWRLRLEPALSISSNLLKKPGSIGADAWQPNVALLGRFDESPSSHWELGLCGDYRFGDYRVYPSASWNWQKGRWSLRLGYPDAGIEASINEALSTGLRVSPAGNRWFVHDSDAGDSLFIHEAWRAEWYLDWHFARSWNVNINLGKLLHNHYEFELESGRRFRDDTRPPWQVRLGIVWHY